VQLAPDQFLAHYSLGLLDQEDRRPEPAVAHFEAALAARPSYVPARVRLASSLRRTGRAAAALEAYRRVLDDDPRHAEAVVGYAMTLVQLGRHREARAHLEAAVQAAPDATAFAHALARLLATAPDASVRDGARARAIVETLVPKGRTLDLGETMAMTLAEQGEYPRAVAVQRDLLNAATRAGLPPVVARVSANLARYERRQPCRVPWTPEEWP
jgi:tetratricopeptide (TPR) repeat protein